MVDKHPLFNSYETKSQRAANALANFVGSWFYIASLGVLLFVWILINSYWLLLGRNWDPYPFIFLNLILAAFAAIEAPIILMSQNRQSQRDRLRSEYDYEVNKKAEREIRDIRKQLDRIEKKLGK